MPDSRSALFSQLLYTDSSLSQRLGRLHESMLDKVPAIERIACALHDS